MRPFIFRLEQVRRYRRQLEEQAMQALARALSQRDATIARIEALKRDHARQRELLCRPHALEAAERWLTAQYESALRQDIANAAEMLAEQEKHVDECRVDLVQKAKDRGLLDSLKEKQAERHCLLERQQEQRTNDETAVLRHNRAAL